MELLIIFNPILDFERLSLPSSEILIISPLNLIGSLSFKYISAITIELTSKLIRVSMPIPSSEKSVVYAK